MNYLNKYSLAILLLIAPVVAFAQEEQSKMQDKSVDKAIEETLATVSESVITIPGMDVESTDEGTATRLSGAVTSALSNSLQEGKNSDILSTSGLSEMQLGQVASSESPFSTLLQLKGEQARTQLESIISEQLKSSGAMEMIKSSEAVSGYSTPEGEIDAEGFVRQLTANTLDVLDKNAAAKIKSMDN